MMAARPRMTRKAGTARPITPPTSPRITTPSCATSRSTNEPNIGFWSGRKPSAEEYFGLLKASYPAIKQACPDDTVVGVCTAGTDLGYIETVLKLGGAKYMDAMSIHPYRYPGSPEATHFVDEMQKCYDLMCKYGMEGKKLWLNRDRLAHPYRSRRRR